MVPFSLFPAIVAKLSPFQMIKFAVTLPDERWKAINHGLGMLNWGADQYLKNYGLKISASPAQVKGRVLPTPEVAFL
jgi:eukaryotic translation initiation factor 2C